MNNNKYKKISTSKKILNNLILEDGYNTDYIYCLIIALFYIPTVGTTKIINTNTNNSNTYYIQEYIKNKFIYPFYQNISIESNRVNNFRMFLYNCGWLRDKNIDILYRPSIDEFYEFLINDMMEYNLSVLKRNSLNNTVIENKYSMIRITDKYIYDTDIINLSVCINNWIKDELIGENLSYKFETLPYIIPIYLDIKDRNNKRYINLMEGISFPTNEDNVQRTIIWDIHSFICQRKTGEYYTVVVNNNEELIGFSDKIIPSNWYIDRTDTLIAKEIMDDIKFIFYKLQ